MHNPCKVKVNVSLLSSSTRVSSYPFLCIASINIKVSINILQIQFKSSDLQNAYNTLVYPSTHPDTWYLANCLLLRIPPDTESSACSCSYASIDAIIFMYHHLSGSKIEWTQRLKNWLQLIRLCLLITLCDSTLFYPVIHLVDIGIRAFSQKKTPER